MASPEARLEPATDEFFGKGAAFRLPHVGECDCAACLRHAERGSAAYAVRRSRYNSNFSTKSVHFGLPLCREAGAEKKGPRCAGSTPQKLRQPAHPTKSPTLIGINCAASVRGDVSMRRSPWRLRRLAMPEPSPFRNGTDPDPSLDPLTSLTHQSENFMAAAVKTWVDEGLAFYADKARDDARALQELQSCKTPLDLINVEQRWIACRAQAYVDAGFRMLTGACLQPEQAAAEAADFRLPE